MLAAQSELARRFATPQVVEDLEKHGFALGGRRIYGSVLFCDIRNFTATAEGQSPEETISLLNDFFAAMFDAIEKHGGVINQMIGDGLMAIFGAPLTHLNPALSAVHAAIDMNASADQLSVVRSFSADLPFRIGVGIATGEMVAGYTGTQRRATYTCVGDTANLAARLDGHTKSAGRSILIDAATAELVDCTYRVECLGAVQLKGKGHAVESYAPDSTHEASERGKRAVG